MPFVSVKDIAKVIPRIKQEKRVFVALDVGNTFVGVATCDPTFTYCFPHATLRRRNGEERLFYFKLVQFFQRNNGLAFVSGYPLMFDDKESVQSAYTKRFIEQMWEFTGLDVPVVLQDEYLSTKEFMERYHGSKSSVYKKGLKLKDEGAAVVILKRFLKELYPELNALQYDRYELFT